MTDQPITDVNGHPVSCVLTLTDLTGAKNPVLCVYAGGEINENLAHFWIEAGQAIKLAHQILDLAVPLMNDVEARP